MAEDVTRYAAVADALDHRGMVSRVGEDVATFKFDNWYQIYLIWDQPPISQTVFEILPGRALANVNRVESLAT
jgi:hypothetical protein